MNRQLITYENGKTLLGNAESKWDIPPGIFHMKTKKNFDLADFNITRQPESALFNKGKDDKGTITNLTHLGNDITFDDKGKRIMYESKPITAIELIE